jgi:hypothetical protein
MTSVADLLLEWPETDQAMWRRLLKTAGPFDDPGALTGLKPTSLEKLVRAYSRWLGWLNSYEPGALLESPATRATAERMQVWPIALSDLSPTSRFMLVRHTLRILRAAEPDAD